MCRGAALSSLLNKRDWVRGIELLKKIIKEEEMLHTFTVACVYWLNVWWIGWLIGLLIGFSVCHYFVGCWLIISIWFVVDGAVGWSVSVGMLLGWSVG